MKTIRQPLLSLENQRFSSVPGKNKQRSAIIYSFAATCKLNGINSYEYLVDVLPKIQDYPSNKIADLLPINWKISKDSELR